MPATGAIDTWIIGYIIATAIGITALVVLWQRAKETSDQTVLDNQTLKDRIARLQQQLTYLNQRLSDLGKQQSLDDILNQHPMPAIVINSSGSLMMLNAKAEELLGTSKLDVIMKPYTECFSLIDEKGSTISFVNGKTTPVKMAIPLWTFLKTQNKSIPIFGWITSVHSRDVGIDSVLFLFEDASNIYAASVETKKQLDTLTGQFTNIRTQFQEEVKKSDLSRLLVQSTDHAVIGIDEDETIRFTNASAEHMLGIPGTELMGKVLTKIISFVDEKDQPMSGLIKQSLSGTVTLIPKWTFVSVSSGRKLPIAGSITPVAIEGKRALILLFTDSSVMYEEEQEEKAFFSGAAHDLRAPLTTIRGTLELLLGDSETIDTQQKSQLLSGAKDSVLHLIALVNNLLNVSRIELNRVQIVKEVFDMKQLTQTVIDSFDQEIKQRKLYLNFEIKDVSVSKVLADKTKTQEILTNLISNAIKYTQQGGVTVSQVVDGSQIVTTVIDTGIGISPQNHRLLFRKFQQVGISRTMSVTKSTGMGLYIAKRFAIMMGGDVELVRSEPEKGSVFSFRVPIAPRTEEMQASILK